MTGSSRHGGFTLAELLAAVAIAAILVLPLADMLRVATSAGSAARSLLDLDNEARFALDRIEKYAAGVSMNPLPPSVYPIGAAYTEATPATWLAPRTYTLDPALSAQVKVTNLVETETSGNAKRVSVIASNVSAFRMTAPEVVAGLPLLRIELALRGPDDATIVRTRTVRLGGAWARVGGKP